MEAINGLTEAQAKLTAEIAAKKAEIKAKKEAVKQAQKEAALLAKNPQVVPGSRRLVPVGEVVDGTVSKGAMVTIQCEICRKERTVNTQDAFQVRYCREHAEMAKKAQAKAGRQARALEKLNPSELEAEIAKLNGLLAKLGKADAPEAEATEEQLEAEVA